jgi:predicted TIM-barrel fold metal-dependent hydrolase
MIVDFQHHFTPRELIKEDPGTGKITRYDEQGVPSYSIHSMLWDLDEHIRMMDIAGIDAAVLSCAEGMCGPLETSVVCNDQARKAERDYPGRFIGIGHAHPLGGPDHARELERCAKELGFAGVVITSEMDGVYLDSPELDPFWEACQRLGLYVFVHPALKLSHSQQFDAFDLARCVGREFSLVMATIRLINGGVFDRFPELCIQMAHLGGGIAGVLGRVRSYQDREFWGTAGNQRHGSLPEHDFDHYLKRRMVFDTAGFCGATSSVEAGLVELDAARIVFASDYPQEIREAEAVKDFVDEIRALGADGETILAGNTGLLLPEAATVG